MLPLDGPRWNEMTCARGSASKLPAIVQRLQHCLDVATELDRDLLGELSAIHQNWGNHTKMKQLADRLQTGLTIKIMPANVYCEGWSATFSDKLIISQSSVDDGIVATALAAFAEYQHTADGGGMNEEDAQVEFIAVRNMLPTSARTAYINRVHHAGTTNP